VDSLIIRTIVFFILTLFFIIVSRRALLNPRSHGFYRFFAFEGITFLILHNHPVWFKQPFSLQQSLSWLCLFFSIILVIRGLKALRTLGGHRVRHTSPENLTFENTQHLVQDGLYRYIRHPMYTSLLLLAWGAFFKLISFETIGAVAFVSLSLFLTAKVEEVENVKFFGPQYVEYKRSSKMFLPFIF